MRQTRLSGLKRGTANLIAGARTYSTAYLRLHERGELERAFAEALTRFAIAQYHHWRRVGASHPSGDVHTRCAPH